MKNIYKYLKSRRRCNNSVCHHRLIESMLTKWILVRPMAISPVFFLLKKSQLFNRDYLNYE